MVTISIRSARGVDWCSTGGSYGQRASSSRRSHLDRGTDQNPLQATAGRETAVEAWPGISRAGEASGCAAFGAISRRQTVFVIPGSGEREACMVSASQLRSGMAIRYEGHLYKVVAADYHPGQGKMAAIMSDSLEREMSRFKIVGSRNSFIASIISINAS